MKLSRETRDSVLVVGITPYFLERGNFWFGKNLGKILEARKTQTFFQENILFVEKDQSYNFSQLLRKLDEMGYEKVLEVSDPGEFSQRGGLIDIFPINFDYAIRLEFFGNKIEDIQKLPIEIQDEATAKEILKKKLKSQKLYSDLRGVELGDYITHLDHGIARFLRIEKPQLPTSNFQTNPKSQSPKFQTQDYYVLQYAQGDKLYVPVGLERKLSRYIGFGKPKISRLGSFTWQRTKKKIKEEAIRLARELLDLYAKREVGKRPPYLPDDEIDFQLASTFPYLETPDQMQALEDIKKDLEKEVSMDRLVCGDVGFGKTEIALRIAVKAVKSAFQVALICPTTILANQHFQNFKERLRNFPIQIALLSRLQSKKEQKEIIEKLKQGKTDIVIGTHRILSNDVEFATDASSTSDRAHKGFGLLIIDDEQRFGVKQKEKLKKLRTSLDVLSLSATPIPRTLYLALSSLKSVSLIQTPPVGRLPIQTFILPWSKKTIKEAVEKEMKRGGQVYYLHNRVETIQKTRNFLQNLVPEARIDVIHGRKKEKELVKVMIDFQNKKTDILIATTIIENGLDLPNVNTLIVADATRLGLAQAYQIRGRVGRAHLQGFAYFLHGKQLTNLAKERLKTLKEATELGSGYKIALKDLEMRGAGNILGKEQSGNVNAVGLNLYCQMLSEAVERLRVARPAP